MGALLTLRLLAEDLAICRLEAGAQVPGWAQVAPLWSVTASAAETSVMCLERAVPEGVVAERGWRALYVAGTLDFALTGILAGLARPLAEAGISIFALSTYDTDYLLVRVEALEAAVAALEQAGYWIESAGE